MRRAEREVKGTENITEIIDQCKVLRLGMCDGDLPYVVPMNFGYETKGDTLHVYLHCSKVGKKLDVLRENNKVCFEMDAEHAIVPGEKGCDYGFKFASVIGFGIAAFTEDHEEKRHALGMLMRHQAGLPDIELSERMIDATEVITIRSESYTGKRRG